MKKQIRCRVFETNSSSTHSLTICSKEEFESWERGEVLFKKYSENNFISAIGLSDNNKAKAEEDYEENKTEFQKDWKDLSEKSKEKYYMQYAKENDIIDDDIITYEEYMDNDNLEVFVEYYTSKNGDEIVVFGKYGYC